MNEVGDVILKSGPRDDDVLDGVPLAEVIEVPYEAGVGRYARTGGYRQLRGVNVTEPYRRLWIYEYVG
jgi:hypothetical protein